MSSNPNDCSGNFASHGVLTITCGWCNLEMGTKDGRGVTGKTSCICDDCLDKYFPTEVTQIKRMREQLASIPASATVTEINAVWQSLNDTDAWLLHMAEHGIKKRIVRHKVAGVKTGVHINSAALRAQSAAGYRALKRYREGRAAHAKELSPQYQVEVRTYFPERPAKVEETFLFLPKQVHTFATL